MQLLCSKLLIVLWLEFERYFSSKFARTQIESSHENIFKNRENLDATARLKNPGIFSYIKFSGDLIFDVNREVDSKGINLAKKGIV